MSFNSKDLIFTEKYRPRFVKDVVLEQDTKTKLLNYLKEPAKMQHLLLHSRTPGTGKTTICKAIINELDCDYKIINSSSDRKIETVREIIGEYAVTKSSKEGKRKIVLLDEVDGMLSASQLALRNTMETYQGNLIFLLTANNINRVEDAIKSRCVNISFSYPPKEEVYKFLEGICLTEKLQYNKEGLDTIIYYNYPSIRNCVIILQDLKTEEKSVIKENIKPINAVFDDMWEMLKQKDWKTIKKLILESTIEARDLNTHFWNKAVEEENIKIIQLCCRNEKDICVGADSKIVVVTSLIEMIK
jgi:DNA polymerase III delta prime subunit